MEKMFTRTLLGAAVAMAAVAGNANAAIELHGQAVQLYGQAAASYQIWSPEAAKAETTAVVEVESRFGLKGVVEFDEFAPNFVWQIETGNANYADMGTDPWNAYHGKVGGRDTYVGLQFENVGTLTFGRRTHAAYDLVDWPHTNPGLGNVFDWHNTIGAGGDDTKGAAFEDRANDMLRFDSANFNGFTFAATLSGMRSTTDAAVISVNAQYTGSNFNIHAGHYTQGEYETTTAASCTTKPSEADPTLPETECTPASTSKAGDVDYSLIGGSVWFGKATITAGYKMMNNNITDDAQDAVSVTGAYWLSDKWLAKVGYAHTFESDLATADDSSTAITGRILYALPSMVWYMDVRNYDMIGADESADGTRFMIGTEYYF